MRIRRFLYLYWLLKVKKINLPTFWVAGHEKTLKDIWKHSRSWRFNWE